MNDEAKPAPEKSQPAPDWRAAVEHRAAEVGVDLSTPTIDELAQHLEDLYTAALAEGVPPEAAHARATAALAE
ncbi:MAG TPA: hypothetical protein VN923_05130, partial [Thermoanaerobaculia bacterium]|nr:hypothetical protein [Thermoanaerobaculia bacterium]